MYAHRPLGESVAQRSEAMEAPKGLNDRLRLAKLAIAPLGVFKAIAGYKKAANLLKD